MKRSGKWLSLFLACTIAITGFSGYRAAYAEDLEQQLEDAKNQGEALSQEKSSAEATLTSLTSQLETLNASITETQTEIDTKMDEIEQAESDLIIAMLDEENQYNAMKLRIQYSYENGTDTALAVVLQSDNIADLLNKVEYVESLSTYDRDMLVSYQEIVASVEEQKATLETEYDELTALEESLLTQQASVQTLIETQQETIASLETQLGQNSALVQSLQTQLDAYNASVEAAQRIDVASSGSGSSSGTTVNRTPTYSTNAGASVVSGTGQLANPCPSGSFTSGFGYRSFDNSFHKGIDLAAPAGTPIYAAESGTVMISGYSSSAGNWIVISHGNGLVTKYMHCSILYVTAGESVSKGQNIAGVGTTGYSTGNHLHFQVEVNGTAVNPYTYL